ncbi:helix-turn-helix domain-containing protein [Rhodoferax sp.]|uniref:helix-turn-helix transcriptional regulator n=1 Tax=Rhodoferax sp. TaxID=50421 RepID=UPI00374D2C7F
MDRRLEAVSCLQTSPPATSNGQDASAMRAHLADFVQRAMAGSLRVHLPHGAPVARGEGHFHVGPELFLQTSGWTDFSFPHGSLTLGPGEALLMPPQLLHCEQVRAAPNQGFANLVVYAEAHALTCHLAHEIATGRPGIRHLEMRQHPQARLIHDWLADAARLGGLSSSDDAARAGTQVHALVAAATAGVLRALDVIDPQAAPESAWVTKVRVLVQNQLGDADLSVRGLAQQCGCTADYLSHLFRQQTQEALVAYINRMRMARAARLLTESALAVKEVAWACGFANTSYFIQTFKTQHGATPKAYRQNQSVLKLAA